MADTAQTAAGYGGTDASVRCLILPLTEGAMLLPNTAVAEVTAEFRMEAVPAAPQWLCGRAGWRGRHVPVVALEPLLGGAPPSAVQRVAVLNTLNGDPELPFLAVAISGIPRLMQVAEGSLGPCREGTHAGLLCRVVLPGGEAVIPDIDTLEAWLGAEAGGTEE